MARQVRSRIAPTPSGLVHEGNAYNFLLAWLHTRSENGKLVLRIDDVDLEKTRLEFVEDIFNSLSWLGLDWDEGPSDVEDFKSRYSLVHSFDAFHDAFNFLIESGVLFPCSCSRNALQGIVKYPGTCLHGVVGKPPFSWRLKPKLPESVWMKDEKEELRELKSFDEMQHSVIWRRINFPAYHLFSVVYDIQHRINLIVRGEDLVASSLFQIALSDLLPKNDFAENRFLHHGLILDERGEKLSKTEGAASLKIQREGGGNTKALFRRFCAWRNYSKSADNLSELLELFIEMEKSKF